MNAKFVLLILGLALLLLVACGPAAQPQTQGSVDQGVQPAESAPAEPAVIKGPFPSSQESAPSVEDEEVSDIGASVDELGSPEDDPGLDELDALDKDLAALDGLDLG